jgi:DNA sulfur modification protein DndE
MIQRKYLFPVLGLIVLISSFALLNQKPTIYMIGDSTMANKPIEDNPERGWGQLLPLFFNDSVCIENHAMNGRSSRSFIYEGRWDSVFAKLCAGDYVIIQFGHNDGSIEKTERYCTPVEYRYNIIKFIKETRSIGAIPVLCTSIQRRKFDENGNFVDTHGVYPDIVRELAKNFDVPLVDMQKKSEILIKEAGIEGSKKIFLHIPAGIYKTFPNGKEDNTHFSEYGAKLMAQMFVDGIKELNLQLAVYLKQ